MAKTVLFQADVRQHTGSKQASRLRQQGRLPAVVYGHKQEPLSVSLNAHDFAEGLHHGLRLLDLEIDGKAEKAVIKEMQYDYLGKEVIHVDLVRVDVSEKVRVSVQVELKGTAKGSHEGGIVETHANQLEVECPVIAIPEAIVVQIKDVGVGDVIHAKDVSLPEGVRLLTSPETIVVTCHLVAAAKSSEDLEAEQPTAPEVIRERKPEAEAGAGAEQK